MFGECYKCIQGEGKYVGIPHILIRLNGCRLRCQWGRYNFCDTSYASWKPEKNSISWNDLIKLYNENPHIKYTMITGGGPTLQPELLKELCVVAKQYNHFITIETEGSEYVQTVADFISLSPKLESSRPIPNSFNHLINRQVTDIDLYRHEEWRKNYKAMQRLIYGHKDYQLKPVITCLKDLKEVKEIQDILRISNDKVYLMPEGITNEQLQKNRELLFDICLNEGYNYSDRLQVIVYGDKRGV